MKKFISMLLVTAFMLAAFSALGTPAHASGEIIRPIPVLTPYNEFTVSVDSPSVFSLSIEESGQYIIQTFGFLFSDEWPEFNGSGIANIKMTLKDSDSTTRASATTESGYQNCCFMYVDLTGGEQYTLEIESSEDCAARVSISLTNDDCFNSNNDYSFHTLRHYNADGVDMSFTFDYSNEYVAQVGTLEGSGTYQVYVTGCGYEQIYISDPRPNSHGEILEECFVLNHAEGDFVIRLEEGVNYYFVICFSRSQYSILNYLGLESIDVELVFHRIGD